MATHSPWARRRRRYFDYPLQAAAVALLYGLFAALPVDWASAGGGWLGRTLGPPRRLAASSHWSATSWWTPGPNIRDLRAA